MTDVRSTPVTGVSGLAINIAAMSSDPATALGGGGGASQNGAASGAGGAGGAGYAIVIEHF